jgi:hypothetical protein
VWSGWGNDQCAESGYGDEDGPPTTTPEPVCRRAFRRDGGPTALLHLGRGSAFRGNVPLLGLIEENHRLPHS